MHKQRCSIRVLGPAGDAWTTPRGARRLISRGLAQTVAPATIRMIEGDPRINCAKKASCRPALPVAEHQAHPVSLRLEGGFLHYPHRNQTTSGKLHMSV